MWGNGLTVRHREPEVMDEPGLDAARHHAALRGLARINRLSGSSGILWPPLAALAVTTPGRPVRILDIGCGGGDVAIGLWRKTRRAELPMEIAGCDVSPTALAFATDRAREVGADIQFSPADVLRDPLPDGYDAIICSLFLHHLSDEEALGLLQRMGRAAGRLVLVNDLIRSRTALVMAQIACRVLTRSPVVRIDGPRSVRAAFTIAEAATVADRAGLHGATINRRWPGRFLLTWNRPSAPGAVA